MSSLGAWRYPDTPKVITRDHRFHLLPSKRLADYAIQGSARAGMPKINRGHRSEFHVWPTEVQKQKLLAANLDGLCEETQRLARPHEQKLAAPETLKTRSFTRHSPPASLGPCFFLQAESPPLFHPMSHADIRLILRFQNCRRPSHDRRRQ
jgi:hypothetical protein